MAFHGWRHGSAQLGAVPGSLDQANNCIVNGVQKSRRGVELHAKCTFQSIGPSPRLLPGALPLCHLQHWFMRRLCLQHMGLLGYWRDTLTTLYLKQRPSDSEALLAPRKAVYKFIENSCLLISHIHTKPPLRTMQSLS